MIQPSSLNLPGMCDAILDEQQIDALFRDLGECARIEQITARAGRGHVNEPQHPQTLEQAQAMLQSGSVRGIQIRYWFNGTCWIDTLMSTAAGVRLVRVQHQGQAPGNA